MMGPFEILSPSRPTESDRRVDTPLTVMQRNRIIVTQ